MVPLSHSLTVAIATVPTTNMKIAAVSAALALVTIANGVPTTPNHGLEAREKEKSGKFAAPEN